MMECPRRYETFKPTCMVSARSARRPGFTLVDVLVAISVMAILIAILLPSFGAAQERARRVRCSSNIRQIGLALQMYCFQNGDQLPPSIFEEHGSNDRGAAQDMIFVRVVGSERSSSNVTWDGLGFLYDSNYLDHPGVFYCPSHHGQHTIDLYADAWRTEPAIQIAANFHYRVPEESRFFAHLNGSSTLVADGMRRLSDYNHSVGNNFLKADLSVGWYLDNDHLLARNLTDDRAPANEADQSVESCWNILDAVSPNGVLRPGFTQPTNTPPSETNQVVFRIVN